MMSKKKWFALLCIFIIYLLMGAAIFHIIEADQEFMRHEDEITKRDDILDNINSIYSQLESLESLPVQKSELKKKLQDYCSKPFEKGDMPQVWDFYHSLFFVITVVSTIGYGNLAPTTMFTRIFMIFYGLIGIPMNGIVMVTLGTYFGRSFTKLYQRWKSSKMQNDTTRLGLISQVILYLVPGFTFFIFLPATFMVLFEGWAFDVAVYYCFVTLTTIGFGDYVAGVENVNGFKVVPYWVYKIGLLIWVIGGLGYVVMILGFITQALQSKKMHEIEQMIKTNIIKTPIKIRHELRTLLQELLLIKVKRSYKGHFDDNIPAHLGRSQSCPELNPYRDKNSPTFARKRAFSECPHQLTFQAQSQLEIEPLPQTEMLQKVIDALSLMGDSSEVSSGAYNMFPDQEILADEESGSKWSLRSQNLPPPKTKVERRRAISDIRVPSMNKVEARQDLGWLEEDYLTTPRKFSESESNKSPNFLTKFKNKFISGKDGKTFDVEQNKRRASMFAPSEESYLQRTNRGRPSVLSVQEQEAVLENTSIADFIRALSVVTVPDGFMSGMPKRKLGTAGLTPPKTQSPPRMRRVGIRPNLQMRRTSLMPESHVIQNERRRLSLRPVDENLLAPPPPYTPKMPEETGRTRKYSRTLNVPTISISPVQRQLNKKENKDET